MAEYKDFLDHTGRTPREFGAVHIYVEPVVRGTSGDAVATVWLQSAFEPLLTTDSLQVVALAADGRDEQCLKRLPLPALTGGKVVRWSVPLSLPASLGELQFRVESKLHPKAERVRPAWKLFDTIEVPKLSELSAPSMPIDVDVAESVVGSLLTGGLSLSVSFGTRAPPTPAAKVHAARKLPPGFIAPLMEGTPERLESPRAEVVWVPGQLLPAPVLAPALGVTLRKKEEAPPPRAPSGGVRTCYSCGFEGPRSEYDRALSCPRCDASWL